MGREEGVACLDLHGLMLARRDWRDMLAGKCREGRKREGRFAVAKNLKR